MLRGIFEENGIHVLEIPCKKRLIRTAHPCVNLNTWVPSGASLPLHMTWSVIFRGIRWTLQERSSSFSSQISEQCLANTTLKQCQNYYFSSLVKIRAPSNLNLKSWQPKQARHFARYLHQLYPRLKGVAHFRHKPVKFEWSIAVHW